MFKYSPSITGKIVLFSVLGIAFLFALRPYVRQDAGLKTGQQDVPAEAQTLGNGVEQAKEQYNAASKKIEDLNKQIDGQNAILTTSHTNVLGYQMVLCSKFHLVRTASGFEKTTADCQTFGNATPSGFPQGTPSAQ